MSQNSLGGRVVALAPDAVSIDAPVLGCFVKPPGDEEYYELTSLEPVQLKGVSDGKIVDEEIPLEALQSAEISLYTAKDAIVHHPFGDLCCSLKTSKVTSLNVSGCELTSCDLVVLAEYVRDATAAIESLDLSGCGLTGATNRNNGYGGHPLWENIDSDMDGWVALCSVIGKIRTVWLADCGLGGASAAELGKMVVSPRTGSITENIDLSGCAIDPTATAQLLSAASEASRLRLRNAQVLAFSAALHERLGADGVIQCNDLIVDVWRKVAEGVRARHGHEVLCSQLASQQPWFEMRVRGLVAEGVPGQ